jgi:hypothetical protein
MHRSDGCVVGRVSITTTTTRSIRQPPAWAAFCCLGVEPQSIPAIGASHGRRWPAAPRTSSPSRREGRTMRESGAHAQKTALNSMEGPCDPLPRNSLISSFLEPLPGSPVSKTRDIGDSARQAAQCGAAADPSSFTNAWESSPRTFNRPDQPYLRAGRIELDKDSDAAIRVDENGDRICGGCNRNVVFGNRRRRRELQRYHKTNRDGAGFHRGHGGESVSARLRRPGMGGSRPPEAGLGSMLGDRLIQARQ